MEVIGAGFGRTGTSSLKVALERLGFGPCYHMEELLSNPSHLSFWESVVGGEDVDWRGFFRDYGAAVDWPACSYYEELMEVYPEAKVILTVRDPERWHASALRTIYEISNTRVSAFFFAVTGLFAPRFGGLGRMTGDLIWSGTFHDRFEEREHALRVFHDHTEEVKRTVPPERLLVYEVKEGWGPLCRFLDVEAPEEPFPHLNDASAFRRFILVQKIFAAAVPLAALSGVFALLTALKRRKTA